MLYNDAYRPILGATKHPQAMGQQGRTCWPEIWPIIGPMLESVLTHGEATWSDNQLLVLDRNGYLEECYFTFSYSPIRDERGQVGGVFTAVTETTAQVISARRLRALRELATCTAMAQTAEAACELAAQALADNRADLPFALLYLLDDTGQQLTLVSATGLTPGEAASPEVVTIAATSTSAVTTTLTDETWPFAQVMMEGHARQMTDLPAQFAPLPGGPWLASPTTALLLPIPSPTQGRPTGLLVAGISPRRTLDQEYRSFLELVVGQVATAIAEARAHEAERKRAEALAELDEAKTTFFSNISHEFRTPLTLMLGPLDDLLQQSQPLAAATRIQLEMIYGNGLQLLKLVNTLLDFSQLQEGRMQARYELTDLAATTRELAGVFRAAIERAGLQLHVACPPLSKPICVDRAMWEKIVLNLLSNAFKFTMTGSITVALKGEDDQIALTVRDTGIGIPAAELPHIFSRFHRVRGAVARTHEGSGIGLALVQELCKLHGGAVQVTSGVGEGSTFMVTIPATITPTSTPTSPQTDAGRAGAHHSSAPHPAHTAHLSLSTTAAYLEEAARWQPHPDGSWPIVDWALTAQAEAAESEHIHDLPNNQKAKIPFPQSRILVADDNADMRTYLAHLLSQHYQVTTVADGAAALAAIRRQQPDLVISDVMMPKLDGFELLQAVRTDPQLRATALILLSARAGEESRVEGLRAGADDYLVKPFSARELLARVEAHLALQRLRQEALSALQQNEARFRVVSELTSDYAYALHVMADGAMQKEWLFGAFEQITGYPPTAAVYDNWQALLHPEDQPIGARHAAQLFAGGADTSEFRIVTKTGETRWLRDSARPQTDAAGRVIRIIGAARDITARKCAEEALQQREAQLQRVMEGSNDGFWDWNVQSGAIYVSPRWYEILGYAPDEFVLDQTHLDRLVHPDDLVQVQATVAAVINGSAGRERYRQQHRFRRKDGTTCWVLVRGSITQRDEAGRALVLSGTITDITARKAAQDALRESEARFRNMADHAPTMIWVTDASGACLFLNRSWYAFTGQAAADTLGFGWLTAVHPEDQRKAQTIFLHANKNQTSFQIDYRLRRHDGVYRWMIDAAAPRFDEAGEFLGYVGSVTDIDERKRAAEAVQRSEQHLRDILDNLTAFIMVLTPDGLLLRANRAALQAAGISPATVLNNPLAESYWWSYDAAVQEQVRTAIRQAAAGADVRFDLRTRLAADHYRMVDFMVSPIMAEAGVTYLVASAVDVTERKRMEQALRDREGQLRTLTETLEQRVIERTIELERSNRDLDQFAYVASHDLKAPLRGINNLARWIAEDAGQLLPEPATGHLVKLRGRIQRMERLLDDLLAYSRVGRREDEIKTVQIKALVEEVVYLLAPPEGFTLYIDEELPTLVTSHTPLELVFRNLIGNAIKHHHQPAQGEVRVSAQALGAYVEFYISDNGPGIDPHHHERIFDLFQVLRPRDEVEGSGMGLALVKKVVEHRKGSICVESTLGQGTTFCFTWPKTSTNLRSPV
ncbi:MAG: PAS domain S-box protein [Caldilineaceae bacterium]